MVCGGKGEEEQGVTLLRADIQEKLGILYI